MWIPAQGLTYIKKYDIIYVEWGEKMAHMVTCSICGEQFDRDKIAAIPHKVGQRRYAHQTCIMSRGSPEEKAKAEQMIAAAEKEKEDLRRLEEYIINKYEIEFVYPGIRKQINEYKEQYGYTYSGIHKALVYFYDIKKNSIAKSRNSIGIVPYVYKDAENYYRDLWEVQQINQAKPIEQIAAAPPVTLTIETPKPHIRKHRELFSFLDEEVENGE